MAPIYIAIALICGYIFASRSPKTRYRYKRSNGWDAYFYVASWGGVFLVAGWFVTSGMSYFGLLRWIANTLGFVKQDIEGIRKRVCMSENVSDRIQSQQFGLE